MKVVGPRRLVNLDELKRRIADGLPLSQVAEQLCDIELRDAGHQKKANCPLHDDSTPSFFINDAKGLWHCYGCKRGGDAITLVEHVHHLGFVDALWMLGEAAGLDLHDFTRPPSDEERKQDE